MLNGNNETSLFFFYLSDIKNNDQNPLPVHCLVGSSGMGKKGGGGGTACTGEYKGVWTVRLESEGGLRHYGIWNVP